MNNTDLKVNLVEVVTNSNDFDKLESIIGYNRKINTSHVSKLKESLLQTGSGGVMVKVLKTKALVGSVQYIRVDGQHRLTACKELGLSFNYMVEELENDTLLNVTKYMSLLNNVVTKWGGDVYLNSYALNGIKEYKIFKKHKEASKLTNTDLFKIFNVSNKAFTSGNMKFENLENSLLLLDAIVEVKDYVPNKAFARRSLFKVFDTPSEYKSLAKAIVNASKKLSDVGMKFSENESEFLNQLIDVKIKMNLKQAA